MKTKCPECGHEFTQTIILSDEGFGVYGTKHYFEDRFPGREIPPYPYNAMGDMMPTLFECSECSKLIWTLDHSVYIKGLCSGCNSSR